MEQRFLRPKEASRFLGIGVSTLWMLVQQGKIKTQKLSPRVTLIDRLELEKMLTGDTEQRDDGHKDRS
ncbi:MAG: helix-turn-helix domain-containing protein [Campylobacterales bacterium]